MNKDGKDGYLKRTTNVSTVVRSRRDKDHFCSCEYCSLSQKKKKERKNHEIVGEAFYTLEDWLNNPDQRVRAMGETPTMRTVAKSVVRILNLIHK